MKICIENKTYTHRQLQKCWQAVAVGAFCQVYLDVFPRENYFCESEPEWSCRIVRPDGSGDVLAEVDHCVSPFGALWNAVRDKPDYFAQYHIKAVLGGEDEES